MTINSQNLNESMARWHSPLHCSSPLKLILCEPTNPAYRAWPIHCRLTGASKRLRYNVYHVGSSLSDCHHIIPYIHHAWWNNQNAWLCNVHWKGCRIWSKASTISSRASTKLGRLWIITIMTIIVHKDITSRSMQVLHNIIAYTISQSHTPVSPHHIIARGGSIRHSTLYVKPYAIISPAITVIIPPPGIPLHSTLGNNTPLSSPLHIPRSLSNLRQ